MTDTENDQITVTITFCPNYVTMDYSNNILTINPPITQAPKSDAVIITLSDPFGSNLFSMAVVVVNTPPTFTANIVDQYINVGST